MKICRSPPLRRSKKTSKSTAAPSTSTDRSVVVLLTILCNYSLKHSLSNKFSSVECKGDCENGVRKEKSHKISLYQKNPAMRNYVVQILRVATICSHRTKTAVVPFYIFWGGIPNPQVETQRFRNIKGYGDGHHYPQPLERVIVFPLLPRLNPLSNAIVIENKLQGPRSGTK